jgi:hypothetical protein
VLLATSATAAHAFAAAAAAFAWHLGSGAVPVLLLLLLLLLLVLLFLLLLPLVVLLLLLLLTPASACEPCQHHNINIMMVSAVDWHRGVVRTQSLRKLRKLGASLDCTVIARICANFRANELVYVCKVVARQKQH